MQTFHDLNIAAFASGTDTNWMALFEAFSTDDAEIWAEVDLRKNVQRLGDLWDAREAVTGD